MDLPATISSSSRPSSNPRRYVREPSRPASGSDTPEGLQDHPQTSTAVDHSSDYRIISQYPRYYYGTLGGVVAYPVWRCLAAVVGIVVDGVATLDVDVVLVVVPAPAAGLFLFRGGDPVALSSELVAVAAALGPCPEVAGPVVG